MKKLLLFLFFAICFNAVTFSQTLFINEICASNYICYADSTGDSGDWIEIYNADASPVDVGGMYLTDDLLLLTKFQIPALSPSVTTIPAGGYKIFWFDNKPERGITHLNLGLSSSGEQIGLTAIDGVTILDSVSFPAVMHDVTFGRITDGTATWSFFPTPTPKTANANGGYKGIAGAPVFNYDGGFYPTSIQVELSYPDPDAKIYYSLNGNEPSLTKGILYTAPVEVDSNATIRARVFADSLVPGEIRTHSFFINRTHDLPVIAITTDSLNLWDYNTGIYTWGPPDYNTSYPYYGANFHEDWKRPAHLEFFESNDALLIDQDVDLSICGHTNRAYAQKSFDLEAKSALGFDKLHCELFPQLPILAYKTLRLRNGGSDWSSTTFRDAMNHTLLEGAMDVDHQSNRPAAIYLNGQYWGILNMCEKLDVDYLNEHFAYVDKDSVDLLESNSTVISGDANNYSAMLNYITANTMSNQANYNYIKTQMDVVNFINFQESRIYYAASDWPSNNVKFWRPKNDLSYKWRWMLWDTDRSTLLNPTHQCGVDHNTLTWATGGGNPAWSIFLLNNLLLNQEFKSKFITQFANHMNFTFCPIRVDSLITGHRDRLTFEMPDHIKKWEWSNENLQGYYTQGYFHNMARWNEEVDTIRLFFNERAHYMKKFIMQKFSITDTSELVVNKIPLEGGIVSIDSFPVPENVCKLVYFNGYSVRLTATPNAGYTFSGWTTSTGDTLPLTWKPNGDTTVTAYFSLLTTSVDEEKNFSVNIFPNPAKDEITVSGLPFTDCLMEIYDVLGNKIYNATVNNRKQQTVNCKQFSSGVYYLKINSGVQMNVRKIVVAR
jgi:hypothetical protein